MSGTSDTTKPSTEKSNQVRRTPQIVSARAPPQRDPLPLPPQPGLGLPIEDSKMVTRGDMKENMDTATKQNSMLTAGIAAPMQPNKNAGNDSYASRLATPVPKQEGRRPSVETAGEATTLRNSSQQSAVRRQPISGANGPQGPVREHDRGVMRHSTREHRGRSEIVELQKRLANCQQERSIMMQAKDIAQKKLDDAKKRNRDLEEQNKQQIEQLRTMSNHLRQAEDLHQQTLGLLEVKTSELKGAQAFLSKEDSVSGADLIAMVSSLNAEILQVAACMVDSLENRERVPFPAIDEGHTTQLKTSVNLGGPILRALKFGSSNAEFDPLPVQIALQVCLVSTSLRIVQSWIPGFWYYDSIFSSIHTSMRTVEGQAITRRWRAITCSRLHQLYWKMCEKECMALVITEITNVLVLAGQQRGSIEEFLSKFHDRLGVIVQSALRLNEATHMNITSGDAEVVDVPLGITFNPCTMDDAFSEGKGSRSKKDMDGPRGIVAGTTDIGIHSTIGNMPAPKFLMKPKVVLVSTLREGHQSAYTA